MDYTPEKGGWNVVSMEVDPNHVGDDLRGLRRTRQPGMEIMKKRGMIDACRFRIRNGCAKGQPNVLIETDYTSIAMPAPNKSRHRGGPGRRGVRDLPQVRGRRFPYGGDARPITRRAAPSRASIAVPCRGEPL